MSYSRKNTGAEDVVFAGVVYRRYPQHHELHRTRYYMSTTAPRTYLHRAIYVAAGNAIPSGWHVHHIDGSHDNNDISNLVAIPPAEHAAEHSLSRRGINAKCDECGAAFAATFERAKWCSPACKERYRRRAGAAYVRPKKPATLRSLSCGHCGAAFGAYKPWARFCGQACRNHFNANLRRAA